MSSLQNYFTQIDIGKLTIPKEETQNCWFEKDILVFGVYHNNKEVYLNLSNIYRSVYIFVGRTKKYFLK